MEEELARLKDKELNSPFGVLEFLHWNHPWNNNKYSSEEDLKKSIALMKEAGVAWVRMDFLWEDMEPERGSFNSEKYDRIVELLAENKINLLGILGYSASWAGANWNSCAYNDDDFINFVSYVISRYKDKVKYWEIWNEPDEPQYFYPQDEMKKYTQLLKKVYLQAKKIDPDCKILTGGLSKTITLSLKRIYKNGGKGYFDILAIHPFVNPLNETDIKRVVSLYNGCKKIMQQNRDDKKIWFTELGCPGVKNPSQENSWWMGISPTEEEQAVWVKRVYTEILPQMPDCEKIFWAFFRDCKDHWHNGVDYFGLIRWDFSKKPSFEAYKEAAQLWSLGSLPKKPKEKIRGILPW